MPLLFDTVETLLNMVPNNKFEEFEESLKKIHDDPKVVQIRDPHLWLLSSNSYVSSLSVVVEDSEAREIQNMTKWIQSILRKIGITNSTVQVSTVSTIKILLQDKRWSPAIDYEPFIWLPAQTNEEKSTKCSDHSHNHGHSHSNSHSHSHGHSHGV